jgi:hypothetical protein
MENKLADKIDVQLSASKEQLTEDVLNSGIVLDKYVIAIERQTIVDQPSCHELG